MVNPLRSSEAASFTPDELNYLEDVFESSVTDRNLVRFSGEALRLAAFITEAFGRRTMEEPRFLEAVRLYDPAQAAPVVVMSDAVKGLLEHSGISLLEDGKLVIANDARLTSRSDDAWNEGRAAYRADPVQGSLSNPYPPAGADHTQWAAGMREKTTEATLDRLISASGSKPASVFVRQDDDSARASPSDLRASDKRRARGPGAG